METLNLDDTVSLDSTKLVQLIGLTYLWWLFCGTIPSCWRYKMILVESDLQLTCLHRVDKHVIQDSRSGAVGQGCSLGLEAFFERLGLVSILSLQCLGLVSVLRL